MKSKRSRIDRFLCQHFQISKRQAQRLLAARQVSVDGQPVNDPQRFVNQFSTISCQGMTIQGLTPTYLMLNKPAGILSATKDTQQTTVLDLIGWPNKSALHIAGRLDKYSTGLLLLSNDGQWSEQLTHADCGCEKVYQVQVQNPISDECVAAFSRGMYFEYEDIVTRPATLTRNAPRQAEVRLTEGRYHQIKRMFGRFRNPVLALHRTEIGPISLDSQLQPGQYRALTEEEVESVNANS